MVEYKGIEEVKDLKVNIESYRKMNTEQFFKLKQSISLFGQLRDIIINSSQEVIEGRKIFLACQQLGFKEISVTCVTKNFDSIQIVLNEKWFETDYAALGQILKRIPSGQLVLPLGEHDIIDYIDFSNFDPEKLKEFKPQVSLFDDGEE